jgi:hypothetical protein
MLLHAKATISSYEEVKLDLTQCFPLHDFALSTPANAQSKTWRESITQQIASASCDVELAANHRYVPALYWPECRTICISRLSRLLQTQKKYSVLSFGSKITKVAAFEEM